MQLLPRTTLSTLAQLEETKPLENLKKTLRMKPSNEICPLVRAKLRVDGFHTVKYVPSQCDGPYDIQAAKETIDLAKGKLEVLVNNAGTFIHLYSGKLEDKECDFCLSCNHPDAT